MICILALEEVVSSLLAHALGRHLPPSDWYEDSSIPDIVPAAQVPVHVDAIQSHLEIHDPPLLHRLFVP
jgi:hypothetical protein